MPEPPEVRIVELHSPSDVAAASLLLAAVWQLDPAASPMGPELLRALAHSGNYVAGAFDGEDLVGVSAGFLAAEPPATLHSHITGVLPSAADRAVGYALKHHQRRWARQRGLAAVVWTFDPLVRRNAYFNVSKLGAEVVGYLTDFYGSMDDGINRGDATDRLLVRWDVDAEPRAAPDDAVAAAGVVLDEDADGRPEPRDATGRERACRAPADITAVRRAAPDLARAWRLAMRAALGGALDEGYTVAGVTRSGWFRLTLGRGVSGEQEGNAPSNPRRALSGEEKR